VTIIDEIKRKQYEYLQRFNIPSKYIICDPTTRDKILYEGRDYLSACINVADIHTIFGLKIALVFGPDERYLEVAG
jgi:hypothetical protein